MSRAKVDLRSSILARSANKFGSTDALTAPGQRIKIRPRPTLGLVLLGDVLSLIQYNRRRAAGVLRKNAVQRENYFRELADASPAMIWITDGDHLCTFLSRNWYEMTGQTKAESMGSGWTDATHPDDRRVVKGAFQDATSRHQLFSTEYRLRCSDGAFRWVMNVGRPRFDQDGSFTGFIGNVIDVHEKRLAEDGLRASENRLRLAAESTGFGTYEFDSETQIAIWSEQLYRIMGVPMGTEIGPEVFKKSVHQDDYEKFDRPMRSALAGSDHNLYQSEFRIIRPVGDVRWIVDTGRVIHEKHFNTDTGLTIDHARAVGTIQDITDRKAIEHSLQRAKKIAETANRSRGHGKEHPA